LKKVVFPLIKQIHPDGWTAESEEIQDANLKCLQLVNQLTNRCEIIESSVATDSQVAVSDPFDAKYELDFYLRDERNGNDPRRIRLQLHMPTEFCERQLLTKRTAMSCLSVLYRRISDILRQSNIKHTAPDAMPGMNDDCEQENNRKHQSQSGLPDITEATLNEFEFDKKALHRISELRRAGIASPDLLFNMEAERRSGEDGSYVRASIKTFIMRGNVMTKGLDERDELDAVLRLQRFLEMFALTINFSLETWGHVNFVFVRRGAKYRFKEINGDQFVVAPANFKIPALLEFIRTNVRINSAPIYIENPEIFDDDL
jgi:hypothetical protein